MKSIPIIWLSCLVLQPIALGDHPRKFDEWGDISFRDEKARLDNVALQWHKYQEANVYLVVFAGRVACVDEAKRRGMRAKNYLVRKRAIKSEHIVFIDGGFRDAVTTGVWIWPPRWGPPSVFPEFNLKPTEVKLEQGCRIKRRATVQSLNNDAHNKSLDASGGSVFFN
jgi:hypothetical protein